MKPFWRIRRWSRVNNWILVATAILVAGSLYLGRVVLSDRGTVATSRATNSTSVSVVPSTDGVTHDVGNDSLPPKGKATVIFSGSGTRTSNPKVLNYDWTGLWSVNCSDEPGISSLRIRLSRIGAAGVANPTPLVDQTVAVHGYESGSFAGVSLLTGSFTVSSTCDWVVTVIDTGIAS